jgi:outer membrane protein assembly factor BamB
MALPILGLVLLWRSPRKLWLKFVYTLGLFLYSIIYMAAGLLLLVRYGGAEMEWRGGYVPVLTWNKTATDLTALERNRATHVARDDNPASPAAPLPYWTGFRGPRRDGHYTEQPIRVDWPTNGLPLLWKQPCGGGYAAFSIANGLAFTLEQRGEYEVAVAYLVESGREVWTNSWFARFSEIHSDEGPRTTPEYSEGQLFVLGAKGELRCLNATNGQTIWRKNIVEDNGGKIPEYGIVPTPLIVDEKLIVQNYSTPHHSVTCYNKRDGSLIWTTGSTTMGYASPMLMTNDGQRQVVFGGRPFIFALRLEDGAECWQARWHILNNERPVAQPLLVSSNRILFSASYMTGGTLFEISPTNGSFVANEIWKSRRIKTRFAAAVLHEGYVYGLDEDILTCIDVTTGEQKWKDGRYGYGQVLLASGHVIIMCADGDLALVKATPEKHEELARFPALKGKTWNVPAIANGRLLVRNFAEMACFDISVPSAQRAQRAAANP